MNGTPTASRGSPERLADKKGKAKKGKAKKGKAKKGKGV